jgi:hypothetical protein
MAAIDWRQFSIKEKISYLKGRSTRTIRIDASGRNSGSLPPAAAAKQQHIFLHRSATTMTTPKPRPKKRSRGDTPAQKILCE